MKAFRNWLVLAASLLYGTSSMAEDKTYLCKVNFTYQLDDLGKMREGGAGKSRVGMSFSIDRDSGEMLGAGLDTNTSGWSVKVLNHGRQYKQEAANYHAIVTSATWPEYGNQVQHVKSVHVNSAFAGESKPFVISDGKEFFTGRCQ